MLDLWPSYSSELNPVDYNIQGIIQQRVYQTKVQNVNDMRQCLTDVTDVQRLQWNRALLTMPLTSGADVSICSMQQDEDILNIHWETN